MPASRAGTYETLPAHHENYPPLAGGRVLMSSPESGSFCVILYLKDSAFNFDFNIIEMFQGWLITMYLISKINKFIVFTNLLKTTLSPILCFA